MPVRSAITYGVVALAAVLVAILLAPMIPEPGGQLVAVVCWIIAVIAAVLAVVALVRGAV